jgi:hypothetical protein
MISLDKVKISVWVIIAQVLKENELDLAKNKTH